MAAEGVFKESEETTWPLQIGLVDLPRHRVGFAHKVGSLPKILQELS